MSSAPLHGADRALTAEHRVLVMQRKGAAPLVVRLRLAKRSAGLLSALADTRFLGPLALLASSRIPDIYTYRVIQATTRLRSSTARLPIQRVSPPLPVSYPVDRHTSDYTGKVGMLVDGVNWEVDDRS